MSALTVEQRIARLEAVEEIRTLKAIYCDLCDQNYDPAGLSALFTEDATWDGGFCQASRHGFLAVTG